MTMEDTDRPKTAQSGLLIDSLTARGAQTLFAQGVPTHFAARKTLFAAGSTGDTLFLIATGRVEISLTSSGGRRTILAQLGPGEVVGEMAALDGQPRSADAVAATEVTGRMINRSHLLSYLRRHPDATIPLIEALCARLRQTNAVLADHVFADGQTRLARLLLRLFDAWSQERPDGTRRLDPRFSQSDIGDMAGLTRESVNRTVRQMEHDGVLRRSSGALVLLDHGALAALAAPPSEDP